MTRDILRRAVRHAMTTVATLLFTTLGAVFSRLP